MSSVWGIQGLGVGSEHVAGLWIFLARHRERPGSTPLEPQGWSMLTWPAHCLLNS